MTAGYAGDAAGKTGGPSADSANKSAHAYYTWSAVLGWVIVGLTVLAIIAGIIIAIMGTGTGVTEGAAAVGGSTAAVGSAEAAAVTGGAEAGVLTGTAAAGSEAAGAELATKTTVANLAAEGVAVTEATAASESVSATPEGKELATNIAKEKKANKSLFDTGKGFSKFIHVMLYIILGITMVLAFTVGLLLAIGAGIQGGSSSKAGLKKAAIGATISLFVVGMYVILFIVMWAKGKSVHKRLEKDLAKQEQMTRDYLQQQQEGTNQAKGQFARDLITHHFGLPAYQAPQAMAPVAMT